MNKSEKYLKISEEIVNGVGGMDNIQGSAHCATRLRIVLKDNDKADMEKLENINKVKETKPGSGSGKGIVGCIYRNYAGTVGGSASYGTDRCAWRSGSCSKIRYTICDQ